MQAIVECHWVANGLNLFGTSVWRGWGTWVSCEDYGSWIKFKEFAGTFKDHLHKIGQDTYLKQSIQTKKQFMFSF